MFPLKNTEAYIHANGYRSTLGKELAARDVEISELGSEIQALTNQLGNEVTTRAALGAHNFAPMRSLSELKTALNDGTWSGDVYSVAGVDVSFLMDGNTVVGAKLNGTSTGEASIYIGNTLSLPAGGYILSTPNKFSGDKSLFLSISNIDITMNVKINTEVNFTIQSNISSGRIYIYFGNGRVFDNFEIKPMIRLATDADATYQPYAKTNVELTADVRALNNSLTFTGNDEFTLFSTLCAQLNADLKNNYDNSFGVVVWSGHNKYQYYATRLDTNVIRCTACKTNTFYTMTYEDGTLYLYSYSGTQITS